MKFEDIKPFVRNVKIFDTNESIFERMEASYDTTLLYLYKGECIVSTETGEFNMKPGCSLLINAGSFFHIEAHGDIKLQTINFDYVFDYNIEKGYPLASEPKSVFRKTNILYHAKFDDNTLFNEPFVMTENMFFAEERYTVVRMEFVNRSLYFERKISSEMLAILIDITRMMQRYNSPSARIESDVYSIIEYISLNCDNNLTNEKIANHFNFSIKHINEKISKATGHSLHQHIIRYKISKAIEYIHDGKMSVSSIAYELGFTDLSHFSKVFKRFVGENPNVYRDKIKMLIK